MYKTSLTFFIFKVGKKLYKLRKDNQEKDKIGEKKNGGIIVNIKGKLLYIVVLGTIFLISFLVGCGTTAQKEAPQSISSLDRTKVAAVKSKFAQNKVLAGQNIKIEVRNTTCILSGTVPEEKYRKKAEDLALSVKGIEKVENKLKVTK